MSKLVIDLIEEFQSLDEVEGDFELFVLSLNISDEGKVLSDESTETTAAVSKIEFDDKSEVCLFHINTKEQTKPLDMSEVIQKLSSINPHYQLGFSHEEMIEGTTAKIDKPIIGFGENIDLKYFFLVCEA